MKKKHRKYTDEFKNEALRLLDTTDQSATAIEKELGITSGFFQDGIWDNNVVGYSRS